MNRGDDDRDRVRAAVNLVEQFAAVTKVRKSGRNHMALCPFHQEKTPSLSIDPARGLFYCHGCHKGGDVFTLVQETQGMSFPEALQTLARQAGIALTQRPGDGQRAAERQRLVGVMRRAVEFYTDRLLSGPDAGPARAYLRSRGYDRSIVEKFGLGFSPRRPPLLLTELRSAGFSDRDMERAGLVIRGDGGYRDRFWDRIMFPIHDLRGEPVGFGARAMGDRNPKYLNSPETPVYRKSRLLYGLHLARREISRDERAVVVEGYTDVIAMHQGGLESAVATCGTALGEDHLEILGRLGRKIVLAFDADQAGGEAVLRGEEVSRRSGRRLNLRVARLPDGKDPADLMQDGRGDDLREAVDTARSVLEYRIERRFERVDPTDPESVAPAVNELAPLVAKVEDQTARGRYQKMLADRSGMDLAEVRGALGRARRRPADPADDGGHRRPPPRKVIRRGSATERELLRAILINHPRLRDLEIDRTLFADGLYRRAFDEIEPVWRETPPGRVTPIRWEPEEKAEGESPGGSEQDKVRMELVRIAVDESDTGDPRPMVIMCRDAALVRETNATTAMMRSLAKNDPRRDRLLGKVWELQRRRQELAGELA